MESTRNASLPNELVNEILLKLPVKSLKRFRCVCRCWLSCIDSTDFVKMHHRTNKVRGSNLNFIFRSFHQQEGSCCIFGGKPRLSLLCNETMLVKETMDFPILNMIGESEFPLSEMVGESEGLILFVKDFRAGLLNPATREFKFIPQSTMEQPDSRRVMAWGFGYDVSTDDYKAVRFVVNRLILDFDLTNLYNHTSQLQVEIYTLSSNCWREIHCYPYMPSACATAVSTYINNTYVNGHYHWWLDFPHTILAFDMAEESFRILHFPFPDEIHQSSFLEDLRVFDNYLSVFASSRDDDDNTITIWLMKDYGVEESWIKQSVIELIPQVRHLLGIWKNDEWLSEKLGNQLMLYNSQAKVVKDLKLCGDYTMYSPLVVFTESLYLLNGTFLNKIDMEEEPSGVMHSLEGGENI